MSNKTVASRAGRLHVQSAKTTIYLFIYLFIYYALPISHNHICTNTNTRIYKLSINQWQGICYSFTPITAALN
jgi:hypothetical protein